MIDHIERRALSLLLVLVMVFSLMPMQAFAAGSKTETGSIGNNIGWSASIPTTTDSTTDLGGVDVDGTTMTITAQAEAVSSSDCSGNVSWSHNQTSTTVTFTNSGNAEAIISFDYNPGNKVEIAGTEYTAAGSYTSASLAADETVTVKFYSPESGTQGTGDAATLTLSNIKWTENAVRSMTVKPGTNGTVKVAGTAITANKTQDVAYATGLAVSASPASGYKFLAWVDENNTVLATTASATIRPDRDNIVVSALFVPTSENGHWIGNKQIFTEFQDALDAAAAGDKQVKLMDNATLTKNYTIPAGVSVLIPYDQALTAYGNTPEVVVRPSSGPPTPKVYCTLTMAAGVTLTVNGSLEVGAKHVAAHGGQIDGGRPWEYYGYVSMGSNSHIDIRSGGTLYAWGYITGSGKVTANSGATIYEKFQIGDYRGGGITSIIVPAGLFPFNQYYVQNVEVKENIYPGAKLICHAGIYLSELTSATINFIGGTDAMFSIASGTISKRYDNATDRMIIDMNGNGAMNPISLMDYNTANFILPVNHNITLNINSGMATVNQDLMLQPGATVNVGRQGYLVLASGKKVYLMDVDNWGNYCFGKPMQQISYVPLKGTAPNIRTADNMTDARVNLNGTAIIQGQLYASTAGALIESVGKTGVVILMNSAPSGTTNIKQSTITASSQILNATTNIKVGAALLTNGDGTTVNTSGAAQYTTYVYDTILDKWVTTGITIAPTLTYNANGGDGADVTQTINFQNTALASKPLSVAVKGSDTFTREGYTLTGWNTAANGSGKAFEVGDYITISANTTLYAVWEGKSFALTVDGVEKGEFKSGANIAAALGKELKYFDFYKDADKTQPVTLPEAKMPGHALYAFAKATYKLVLDGAQKADGLLAGDTIANKLGKGLTDVRFYSDAACSQVVTITEDKMPARDLYAKSLYTLTFMSESGDTIFSEKYVAGETITAPAYTAPEGATFTGWWNETDGVEITFPTTMPAKDQVVVPVNKSIYNVALMQDEQEKATYQATNENGYSVTITIDDPTKENHTFKGWSDGKGNYYKNGATISNINVDMELIAEFEPNTYTVKFGDTVLTANKSNNWTVTVPNDPTQAGASFLGWATTENATAANTDYKAGEQVSATGNLVLYPVFQLDYYTLTLNANGGKYGEQDCWSTEAVYGTKITYPENLTAPTGYEFSHWTLNGQKVNSLPSEMPADNREYIAVWNEKTVEVKFNDNGTEKTLSGKYFSKITAPTPAVREGYTFQGWAKSTAADEPVLYAAGDEIELKTAPATLYAKWKINTFGVTYVNGESSETETVNWNTEITVKDLDDTASHTFEGWKGSDGKTYAAGDKITVKSAITLTAQWKIRTYTITWNVNGVKSTTTVNHGETPVYNENTPTKEADEKYTYNFTGWTPEPKPATGNQEYTASFGSTLRKYDVTFIVDGNKYDKQSVNYGEKPTVIAPTKAADNYNTYMFAGWKDAAGEVHTTLPAVEGETTYTATWTTTPKVYNITLVVDGETVFFDDGGYGEEIDYTNYVEPSKTGHSFAWSKTLPTTFTENVTINGVFTPNTYTITFKNDFNTEKDDEFQDYTISKKFGEPITQADIDELNATLPTITGWELVDWYYAEEVEIEGNKVWRHTDEYEIPAYMGAENVDVYAYWDAIVYDLTVVSSIDHETIGNSSMRYEEAYTDLEEFNAINNFCYDPECRDEDHDHVLPEGYTFAGYKYEDGSEMTFPIECWPAEEVTIIAQFVPKDYTVTFMSEDQEIGTITAPYGSEITLPEDPTMEGHNFAGWVDAQGNAANLATMPLNGMTVFASFTKNSYQVNFFASEEDDTAYKTIEVPYDTALNAEELVAQVSGTPEKYGYNFSGWNTDKVPATMPAGAVNIYGTWSVKETEVAFYRDSVEEENWLFFSVFRFGEYYEDLQQFIRANLLEGYTPDGYSLTGLKYENGTDVTFPYTHGVYDLNMIVVFTPNTYTITFDVEGIDSITAACDSTITWPQNPTQTGYIFEGWDMDGDGNADTLPEKMPVGGLNLKAVWVRETVYIIWDTNNGTITQEYKYGDRVVVPDPGVKSADSYWTYKFLYWTDLQGNEVEVPEFATVGDHYVAASERDEAVKYDVKFLNGEDTVYETKIAWNEKVTLDDFTAPTKEGYDLTWAVNGETVTFPYQMTIAEVTFVAQWTPKTYTITIDGGEPVEYIYGAVLSINEPATKEGHTFAGWLKDGVAYELPEKMPAYNLVLTSNWTVNTYELTVGAYNAAGEYIKKTETVPYGTKLSDYYPEAPSFVDSNGMFLEFNSWGAWTWENNDSETMVKYLGETMPASDVTVYPAYVATGWVNRIDGKTSYVVKDNYVYYNEWATIDGEQYWFDGESFIAKDITLVDGEYYAFDHETGKFLSDLTGKYEAKNGDLYYVENGVAVANKGLVRIYENGEAKYYYFGCAQTDSDGHDDNSCDLYKAQKNTIHWVENNNDLLPKWDYTFGADGVIAHIPDYATFQEQYHAVITLDGVKYYTIDGIKVHMGLFIGDGDRLGEEGEYYYARSSGALVAGQSYWISESHLNGVEHNGEPVEEGSYTFDERGCIVWRYTEKNGIYAEDGKLYYYEDNERTYAGLIYYTGTSDNGIVYNNDLIYVRTSGELATGQYWTTKNNGNMASASYQFDEEGKMIRKNGMLEEDGGIYYYVNGNRFHAGLIMIDGEFYYVKTSGQVVTNCTYWITHTNGYEQTHGINEGSYEFEADGRMVVPEPEALKNGIVEEDGKLYYYVEGVRTYAGAIKIGENWYYVRTSGELARNTTYWVTKNNGLVKSMSYTFDENGVMQNPVVLGN